MAPNEAERDLLFKQFGRAFFQAGYGRSIRGRNRKFYLLNSCQR